MPRPSTPAAAQAMASTPPDHDPRPAQIPGLDEALAYLEERRVSSLDAPESPPSDIADMDDLDDLAFDPPEIFPREDQCRNKLSEVHRALAMLRVHAMVTAAGDRRPFEPEMGCLHLVIVPTDGERSTVYSVIKDMRDAAPLFTPSVVHVEKDAGVESRYIKDLMTRIRADLLAGHGILAILSSAEAIPDDLRPLVSSEARLPPLSGVMLRAVLAFHMRDAELEIPYSDRQIGRLSRLALTAVLTAENSASALRHLDRAMNAGAAQTRITLYHVHGQPDTVGALEQVVQDLHDFQAGRVPWVEVMKSFLLIGPPGTGKTMLAEALAGSAGISLVKTSYSDCQKEGHQGDMLKALAGAVESAIATAPSVFFIDEIDSFHNRRGRMGSKDGYIIGVVNGLLTQLDRLSATPGVILIAATNYAERVDPAVIRAGRFDKHIRVGPPDRTGIRSMLSASVGELISAADIDALSDQLLGTTGAQIAAVLRDARTRARAAGGALGLTHLRAAADAVRPAPDAGLMWRVAVHETGHVLAGYLLDLPPANTVRIAFGDAFVTRFRPVLRVPDTVHRLICSHLAGRIAEEVILDIPCDGSGNGPESDLAQATRLAVEAECAHGFGESLAWSDPQTPFHTLPRPVQARVEARLRAAAAEVRQLFLAHRSDLERIAQVLLDQREMDADAIAALLSTVDRDAPADHKESTSCS